MPEHVFGRAGRWILEMRGMIQEEKQSFPVVLLRLFLVLEDESMLES